MQTQSTGRLVAFGAAALLATLGAVSIILPEYSVMESLPAAACVALSLVGLVIYRRRKDRRGAGMRA